MLLGASNLEMPLGLSIDQIIGWFESQPWLTYAPDLPIIRRYWQSVFRRRPMIGAPMILPDLLMIARAVELGMGLSVLPEYLCAEQIHEGRLQVLWEPDYPPRNRVFLAVNRPHADRSEIRWLHTRLAAS
ncbi:MAG: LysR substrate-binding domain-containing protein [Chloroflexota bacterium]